MTPEKLDLLFPFVVFGYGVIMTVVSATPILMQLAEQRLPQPVHQQLRAHQVLGWVCFLLGGLWSLQNLWLS